MRDNSPEYGKSGKEYVIGEDDMNAPAKQAPGDPVGYSDPWCAEPGGMIRFMVSTRSAAYRASLVRLVGLGAHGERPVVSDIDGQYPGRHQVARAGSCITVQAGEALQTGASRSAAGRGLPG